MKIEIVAEDRLGAQAAARVSVVLREAVRRRGRATVAFSGGSGAASLFAGLADAEVPWPSVDILQVDERVAPPDHPDRNLSGLRAGLLAHVPVPQAHIHPMPVEDPDLEAAAERYAELLRAVTDPDLRLDLVHLGIGTDGHTASLAPGSPLLNADAPPVAMTPLLHGRRRMTLTLPILNAARDALWLVGGAEKATVVRRVVDGDRALPAANVTLRQARLLLDTAAASRLDPMRTTAEPEKT
ncbi:MAG: 6-phosphogluconolactonase [Nitriliruptoraceae bacterium]